MWTKTKNKKIRQGNYTYSQERGGDLGKLRRRIILDSRFHFVM